MKKPRPEGEGRWEPRASAAPCAEPWTSPGSAAGNGTELSGKLGERSQRRDAGREHEAEANGEAQAEVVDVRLLEYNERDGLATYRIEEWMKKQWPEWDPEERDCDEFSGTLDCPICRQSYLVSVSSRGPCRQSA
jgi:hypothetical protein